MSKPFFVPLRNRGLIHIEGEDRGAFLQGLISNDVTKLETLKIVYACLLTPQGKFIHDFFLHHGDGFILIDCEGGARATDLYERLNKYKLRAKVQISIETEHPVYAVFNSPDIGLPDPRHFKMGNRTFQKPDDIEHEHFEEWDQNRIILGIADGSRDLEVGRSTLLECSIDKFNGVDFDKGCYVGQELTARMHHRNLGKKHLRTLDLGNTHPPAPFSDLVIDGVTIGNMRSACGNVGLAVIKDAETKRITIDKNQKQTNQKRNQIRLLG